MEKAFIIELNNGRRLKAFWTSRFVPAEKEVPVVLAESKEEKLIPFSRVSCILMFELLSPEMQPQLDDPLEIVECASGSIFNVRILKAHQKPEGFFAVPVGKESSYRLIFFTEEGVKSRTRQTRLGQILEDQGVIYRHDLDKALSEQRRLRERRIGEILSQEHQLEQDVIEQLLDKAKQEGKVDNRHRVGDILVSAGLVSRKEVEEALTTQGAGKKKKIGRLLIELGLVTEEQVLAALAVKFNMPFVDLDKIETDRRALAVISADLVRHLQVFPVSDEGDYLEVATSNPTDNTISDILRFHTNRRIKLITASPEQIKAHIAQHYPVAADNKQKELMDNIRAEELVWEEEEEDIIEESDSEIIRLANWILINAYQQRASDIHLEPIGPRQPLGVRYRVDGVCRVVQMLPSRFSRPLIARMKVMANLNVAEHRKPQSGKIFIRYQGKKFEYRVEIAPTIGGQEDAVLRILSVSKPILLDEIGLSPANLAELKKLIVKPYGIILCVGPTGSGKTTTLHAALSYINTPERKIWTVEDPVEITQMGLRQMQVKPQIGLTFQVALRSLLRADPDVVMIGEMRDQEAAHTAIEASLTGHLVFSTLHTNSAAETVTRLIEMGEEPINLADALLGILAQRLARRLCPHCKEAYHPTREEYADLNHFYGDDLFREHGCPEYSETMVLMRKKGCEKCGDVGYQGRIAVNELLLCTTRVKQAIKSASSASEIEEAAVENGMRNLRMDGIGKVIQGETDLEQIMKVCL